MIGNLVYACHTVGVRGTARAMVTVPRIIRVLVPRMNGHDQRRPYPHKRHECANKMPDPARHAHCHHYSDFICVIRSITARFYQPPTQSQVTSSRFIGHPAAHTALPHQNATAPPVPRLEKV